MTEPSTREMYIPVELRWGLLKVNRVQWDKVTSNRETISPWQLSPRTY